jgi:hypothetical protein
MADSIEKVLNPSGKALSEEQKDVVKAFDHVDQELSALDRLSTLIGQRVAEASKKLH